MATGRVEVSGTCPDRLPEASIGRPSPASVSPPGRRAMTRQAGRWWTVLLLSGAALCACRQPPLEATPAGPSYRTAHPELDALQARLGEALESNRRRFVGRRGLVEGFGAGETYPQIWLRDSATLLPLARFVYDRELLTSWIEEHLWHQEPSGGLFDWIASGPPEHFVPFAPRVVEVHRDAGHVLSADKNTTEADQEASAILAAAAAFDVLGDGAWLRRDIDGVRLIDRLDAALQFVLSERLDDTTRLVANAFTADWGDVSPTHADQRAIYLDDDTPQVVGLYTNAIVRQAALELARLHRRFGDPARAGGWQDRADAIARAVREVLWDETLGFFRVHALVAGEQPGGFDDAGMFALGGNALAVSSGIASGADALRIFAAAESRRVEYGLSTIAASLVPPYPDGVFRHPIMRTPGTYQNGGQWDWFAGRFILAEFQRGDAERAAEHLVQLARRIVRYPGLFEWYTLEDVPRGSRHYAGNAGALASAILEGLFGIELRDDGLRLRVRLGDEPGEVDVREPASGRQVRYRYHAAADRLELAVDTNVPVERVHLLLPGGRDVVGVTIDLAPAPHVIESMGYDRYVALGPVGPSGRVTVALRPAGSRLTGPSESGAARGR